MTLDIYITVFGLVLMGLLALLAVGVVFRLGYRAGRRAHSREIGRQLMRGHSIVVEKPQ